MSSTAFLPFALPLTGNEETNEVINSIKSGWLTTGAKTKKFEEKFSRFIGAKHAVAINSATAGLHLALEAIGVSRGDKVITTPYTFTATAEVIRYLGADPVFVDIAPDTFNIGPEKLENTLKHTENIKAIIPVHFAGQACDMEKIMNLAKKYNVKVIEDAAHALPSSYNGKLIGTFGDITVFSFYATKTITTGEGGMAVTNNSEYAKRMRIMRLHGISLDVFDRYTSDKPAWEYDVVAPGFKYNMTDIAASLGIHQLAKAWKFQQRREWIAKQYDSAFGNLPLKMPIVKSPEDIHSWHLYVIQLELEKLSISRNKFIEKMAQEGIGTSVHFIPLHIFSYWREKYGYVDNSFPVAFDAYSRAVSLPIYPKMTDEDVAKVIRTTKKILTKYRK